MSKSLEKFNSRNQELIELSSFFDDEEKTLNISMKNFNGSIFYTKLSMNKISEINSITNKIINDCHEKYDKKNRLR